MVCLAWLANYITGISVAYSVWKFSFMLLHYVILLSRGHYSYEKRLNFKKKRKRCICDFLDTLF